jgi:putative endonuclease
MATFCSLAEGIVGRDDGWRSAIHPLRHSRAARRAEPGIHNHGCPMVYYIYLLASKKHGTLYLGVTNDIVRRVYEHRTKAAPGFTSRYDIGKLVWFEIYDDAIAAISREKELKKVAARLEDPAD